MRSPFAVPVCLVGPAAVPVSAQAPNLAHHAKPEEYSKPSPPDPAWPEEPAQGSHPGLAPVYAALASARRRQVRVSAQVKVAAGRRSRPYGE